MHEKDVFQSVKQLARKTKSEYCQQESNLRSTQKRLHFVVVVVFPQKIWTEIKGEICSHKSSPKRYKNFALSCIGVEENLNWRILSPSSNFFASSWHTFLRFTPEPSIQYLSECYFILLVQIPFRP